MQKWHNNKTRSSYAYLEGGAEGDLVALIKPREHQDAPEFHLLNLPVFSVEVVAKLLRQRGRQLLQHFVLLGPIEEERQEQTHAGLWQENGTF